MLLKNCPVAVNASFQLRGKTCKPIQQHMQKSNYDELPPVVSGIYDNKHETGH